MENKPNNNKISCIITAHNEENRIEKVLRVFQNNNQVKEVIVINDGSTDNTGEIIKKFRNIKLITYKKNIGKASALLKGIKEARGDFLMLIDSDLYGLNKKNISDLICPILSKNADVSMVLMKSSFLIFKILGVDFVSGQRVFKKSFISNENISDISSYGFEPFMNKKIIKQKLRLCVVKWDNVSNPRKKEKVGFLKGSYEDYTALWHTIKTVGISGMMVQLLFMPFLKVRD